VRLVEQIINDHHVDTGNRPGFTTREWLSLLVEGFRLSVVLNASVGELTVDTIVNENRFGGWLWFVMRMMKMVSSGRQ